MGQGKFRFGAAVQQIRGSCSPLSISNARWTPIGVTKLTLPGWDAVTAPITAADLQSKTSTSNSSGGMRTSTMYNIQVRYSYRFNGKDYEGTRFKVFGEFVNDTLFFILSQQTIVNEDTGELGTDRLIE